MGEQRIYHLDPHFFMVNFVTVCTCFISFVLAVLPNVANHL